MDWFPAIPIVLFLSVLLYTALVIKNEKNHFLKNAKIYRLGDFTLRIPAWWRLVKKEKNLLEFSGNKDHQAIFFWEPKALDLEDDFLDKIKKEKIIFDFQAAVLWEKTGDCPCLRVEGSATKEEQQRLYFDACLIEGPGGQLFSRSYSGILQGVLEGPWFDHILQNINILKRQEVGIS
ncbi:MAG: hypothetical protein OXB84_02640 [Halobacteriovoraceae bacterium]|nr:hypothetical protein [Halobacteriovoraceae bacterium]